MLPGQPGPLFDATGVVRGPTVTGADVAEQPPALVTVTVTVDCKLPTCVISKPTHDTLNGVAAPQGDRASSVGSD